MGTTESSAVHQHETREYILEMISELASLALRCGETRIALALDEILSETNPGLPRG